MNGLDVEGVLDLHRAWTDAANGCRGCDWKPDNADYAGAKHRAHVAAVLREQVAAWLGSEVDAVARAMCGETWDGDKAVPVLAEIYRRHADKALSALAAQLAPARVPSEES